MVKIKVQRRAPSPQGMVYKIGRRHVCRCIFRHRFPVSSASMYRYEAAKRKEAVSAYALRKSKAVDIENRHDSSETVESVREYRGMLCVAWLLKYAEETWINYDGLVYCAQVPNNILIVRRNGKVVAFEEDKINDYLKYDKCDWSCKKINYMIKHMNTKHCSDHVEKTHNSNKKENTSNDKLDEITDKDEIKQTSKVLKEKKCIKCNKLVMKEDNTKENIFQYCIMTIEYA